MITMLAGRLHLNTLAFAVEEAPIPVPAPGEVLIQVRAAGGVPLGRPPDRRQHQPLLPCGRGHAQPGDHPRPRGRRRRPHPRPRRARGMGSRSAGGAPGRAGLRHVNRLPAPRHVPAAADAAWTATGAGPNTPSPARTLCFRSRTTCLRPGRDHPGGGVHPVRRDHRHGRGPSRAGGRHLGRGRPGRARPPAHPHGRRGPGHCRRPAVLRTRTRPRLRGGRRTGPGGSGLRLLPARAVATAG